MQFIQRIGIRDFRSISSVELANLDNIVPIVGPNGGGKSNLLRALNLFFNSEVEPGVALDLSRDFHEPGARRKVKKRVVVELDMSFGDGLRPQMKDFTKRLAGNASVFTIAKHWTLNPATHRPEMELRFGPAGEEPKVVADQDRGLVERLVSSVRFRYISNHVHPTDVLRREEENLRRALFRRLGKSPSFTSDQIDKIREAAHELMRPVTDELKGSAAQITDIELGTPSEWGELVWLFGLQLNAGQTGTREAALQGSGIQSALAYAILHSLDTNLGSDFGWRRGAIWAVEEPESFLHADLQAQLAESFSRYSNDATLQVLLTTHNTAFLGVADNGVAVGLGSAASEIQIQPRADLIETALKGGVTPFTHPLHVGSVKPLLLVEGKDDRELIVRAYKDAEQPCPYDIQAMEDIEPLMRGGVEQIRTYLKNNVSALRARASGSPVVVLVDHEVSDGKVASLNTVLKEHPTSACHRMQSAGKTQGLKPVAGIEAYLSLDFYRAAEQQIGLNLIEPSEGSSATWRLGIEPAEMGSKKAPIHKLLAERSEPSDIAAITALVPALSKLLVDPLQSTLGV
ncbi:MAG TPA: AAA family ATPase [Solirubrobacteraceae bacterium]|jgi:energy-coupling factor transporter ATP-binding protein EcfA2|nr:AAA family ATPase [Solirubrobacteraceae bacterium]